MIESTDFPQVWRHLRRWLTQTPSENLTPDTLASLMGHLDCPLCPKAKSSLQVLIRQFKH